MSIVYVVDVLERHDGVYVFEREQDAKDFAAVLGHDCYALTEEHVIDAAGASTLIEMESLQ